MVARPMSGEAEDGFTLIELLVVMIIIGILAAIAIPVFLNQRQKAADASMKSDLRNIAHEEFTYFVDAGDYATLTGAPQSYQINGTNVSTSKNNTLTVTRTDAAGVAVTTGTAQGFCIVAANPNGTHAWVYKSQAGGLQPNTVLTCP